MVKLRFRLGRGTEKTLTLHDALENESNLHVNERQKIRHYRSRSTGEEEEEEEEEEERQMAIFYFARRVRQMRYYGDVILSSYWKSAAQHDGGV